MIKSLCEKIREFHRFPDEENAFTLQPFKGSIDNVGHHHHFLVFLKPELFSLEDGVNLEAVLEFAFAHFNTWGIRIEGIRALSGMYLRNKRIISHNYETLHKISYKGWNACSEKVRNLLKEEFKHTITPLTQILGGHQFLEVFPKITPFYLNEMLNSLTTKKLGSGAYAVHLNYDGGSYLLLNAFHPYQIESLTIPGSGIIALECYSNLPWSRLRRDVVGTIYPQDAQKDSFRRELYEKKDCFNIKVVDISHNGIHISPGPLEAAFQLLTFFVPEQQYIDSMSIPSMLKNLANKGFSKETLISLKENPLINDDSGIEAPLFQWMEDMNNDEAYEFIQAQFRRKAL